MTESESAVTLFTHKAFGEIRSTVINGKPVFGAIDIARALRYTSPADAVRYHCKGVVIIPTPTRGGMQKTRFIPQSDVIRLIMRSKLPAAEQFQDWVCEEVIPSILRTGTYTTPQPIESRQIGTDLSIPPVHQSVARVIAGFEIGTHGTISDFITLVRTHAEIAPAITGAPARPIHDEPPVPHLNDPFAVFLDLYHLAFSKGAAQIEVTIADLLAANAPLAGDFADRHRACGKRLAELAHRPFTTIGTKTPLIVKAHRTAKRRFYTLTRPDQLRADLTATQ